VSGGSAERQSNAAAGRPSRTTSIEILRACRGMRTAMPRRDGGDMLVRMLRSDPPERVRLFSRREYDRMVELGMFEDERLELLRGLLVPMSPQKRPHAIAVAWLTEQLVLQIDRRTHIVRPQLPFAAGDWSEPEPDLAVVARDFDLPDHPSEVLLLIEVADSSLRTDRGVKLAIYAEARVPEYWILDLQTMTVAIHTEPRGDTYGQVATVGDGDVLRPVLLPTIALAIAEIPR
jgi:Uma2 family endonuclease